MLKLIESLRDSFYKFEDPKKWDRDSLTCASTIEDALYVQTVLDSIRKSSKSSDWEKVSFVISKLSVESHQSPPFHVGRIHFLTLAQGGYVYSAQRGREMLA